MLKVLVQKWDKNKDKLQHVLETRTDLRRIDYKDLVKLTFGVIYNDEEEQTYLNIDRITEINDGDYQGTLLFLIPLDWYQPSEYDYLMTCVGYGSCSGCDALEHILSYDYSEGVLTKTQVKDFMTLCKDIITNTIKPYNGGWRNDDRFDQIEEDINNVY